MEIRLAYQNDFIQIAGLMAQLNPGDPALSEKDLNVFYEILNSNHLKLLVAEENGKLVGSCYLNIILNLTRGTRPYSVIENVITDENHRKKGIGIALVNKAIEISKTNRCYKIMLMSGRKDESVRAFYKKCGFSDDQKQAYILRTH